MMFVVMCASGAERKYWVLKTFSALTDAKKYVARQNAIQRDFHQTGHWRYKIEEMTEDELIEKY